MILKSKFIKKVASCSVLAVFCLGLVWSKPVSAQLFSSTSRDLDEQISNLQTILQQAQSATGNSRATVVSTGQKCVNGGMEYEDLSVIDKLWLPNGNGTLFPGYQYRCVAGKWRVESTGSSKTVVSNERVSTANGNKSTVKTASNFSTVSTCANGIKKYAEGASLASIKVDGKTKKASSGKSFICRAGTWTQTPKKSTDTTTVGSDRTATGIGNWSGNYLPTIVLSVRGSSVSAVGDVYVANSANCSSNSKAVINWGDGAIENIMVSCENSKTSYKLSHTFSKEGSFNITLTDQQGKTVVKKITVSIGAGGYIVTPEKESVVSTPRTQTPNGFGGSGLVKGGYL